jgi:hypothetical protein
MDHKGKGMVINDKEKKTLYVDEPKGDKPTDSGSSHKKRDGKKERRIKKIIYFDGEDYLFWSHKIRSHLFSLHPNIWEIVENGMHFDSTDNPILINEQIHKNAQATTILLASLCRNEYNKVSGLDNAKQIWDTLKISDEGNDATMITKIELVEGELGRFAMIRGEEPTQTYNKLKTLVNKIQSYGSTRWIDHDVVLLMLRSFTVIDPHLVNLIRENPMYIKMIWRPKKFWENL